MIFFRKREKIQITILPDVIKTIKNAHISHKYEFFLHSIFDCAGSAMPYCNVYMTKKNRKNIKYLQQITNNSKYHENTMKKP